MSSGKANEVVGDLYINGTMITASPASLNNTSNTTGTNTGDQTIALTGDVTGSGTGSFAATIANNAVTYAKMQQETKATLLGNPTGSTANVQEIVLGTNLSFSGSTLNAAGSSSPLNTKGDIYTYTNADAKLGVGSNTQSLYADSSTSTGMAWDVERNQKSLSAAFWCDAMQSTSHDWLPAISATGTGAGSSNSATTQGSNGNRIGVTQLGTGSTSTGRVDFLFPSCTGTNYWYAGYGQLIYEVGIQLGQTSNSTDRFNITAGFTNSSAPGSITDGIYFYYEDDSNSGNWVCRATASSANTDTNSSTAAGTSYVRLKIIVNAAGSSATFYVNDTSIGTVSSGLPTAGMAPHFTILKNGGSNGATNCTSNIDWIFVRKDFTTPR